MNCANHKQVLVTGASGFIGGRLVRRLIECGCEVSCLVRANSRIDELLSVGAQLLTGDVTDLASVCQAVVASKADVVFHLAGLVRAQRWRRRIRGRDDFMQVNAGGVDNVATACTDRTDPPVLVVVSSLAAVGPCTTDQMRVESDISMPASNYGRSKLAGEQAAEKHAGEVPITMVRPPVVFGPGDGGVLEVFRPIARWGLHLVPAPGGRRGDGGNDRRLSLIYVDDLVEGLLLAAEKGERLPQRASEHSMQGQGIYFMAGDEHPTLTELGQIIAAALGKRAPTVIHLPVPLVRLVGAIGDVTARIRGRPVWISSDKITEALAGSWMCSSAKARTQLGWFPASNLADRLLETAQWYRQAGWL